MSAPCPNRTDEESGSPCGDEGHLCEPCFQKEAARWARHFGQDRGTKAERQSRLEAMDPRNDRARAEAVCSDE